MDLFVFLYSTAMSPTIRDWYINLHHNGCDDDPGWILVAPVVEGCPYETDSTLVPKLLYSSGTGYGQQSKYSTGIVLLPEYHWKPLHCGKSKVNRTGFATLSLCSPPYQHQAFKSACSWCE